MTWKSQEKRCLMNLMLNLLLCNGGINEKIMKIHTRRSRSTSKMWSPTDYMTSKEWSPNHFFLSPVFALGYKMLGTLCHIKNGVPLCENGVQIIFFSLISGYI